MNKKSNILARSCIGAGLVLTALLAVVTFLDTRKTIAAADGLMCNTITIIGDPEPASVIPHSYRKFFKPPQKTYKDKLPVNLTKKQRLICEAGANSDEIFSQSKELHELFPKDKAYLARYITSRKYSYIIYVKDYKATMKNPKKKAGFLANQKRILTLLSYAEKIDPDNALYNYLKANTLFAEALVYKISRTSSGYKLNAKKKKKEIFRDNEYIVVDEKKLMEALKEFKKGLGKPYCKTYAIDLLNQQTAILHQNRVSFNDYAWKLTTEANLSLSFLHAKRALIRSVSAAIIYNYEKGNYADAKKLIATWKPFTTQQMADSHALIGYLVINAIDRLYFQVAIDYYNVRNNKKLASYYKNKLAIVKDKWLGGLDSIISSEDRKSMGFLSKMFLTGLPIYDTPEVFREKLYPENIVTYKLVEQFFIMLFIVILFITLIIYGLAIKLSKNKVEYIKLNKKEFVRIIGAGFILPLAVYLTITNIDYLSNREFNIKSNAVAFIGQLIILALSILVPLGLVACCTVRNYCRKANIPVANDGIFRWSTGIAYWIFIGVVIFAPKTIWLMIIVLALSTIITFSWGVYSMVNMEKYRLFNKLVNKNLFLYLAIFPIIAMLVLFVVVKYQEYYYIEKDEILFAKESEDEYFTSHESKVVKKLIKRFKTKILED